MAGYGVSKYKQKYCKELIDCLKIGGTIAKFALSIGVHKDTINEWTRAHPEFGEAMKTAKDANESFWMDLAVSRAQGLHQGSDALIKYILSASHGYREKTESNVTADVTADVTVSGKLEVSFLDIEA